MSVLPSNFIQIIMEPSRWELPFMEHIQNSKIKGLCFPFTAICLVFPKLNETLRSFQKVSHVPCPSCSSWRARQGISKEEDKKGMQSLSWSPDQLQNSGPGQGEDILPKGQWNQWVSQWSISALEKWGFGGGEGACYGFWPSNSLHSAVPALLLISGTCAAYFTVLLLVEKGKDLERNGSICFCWDFYYFHRIVV